MAKLSTVRESQDFEAFLKSFRADPVSYRQLFDLLGRMIPIAEGLLVTSMPRGGLQIVQPAKLSVLLLKEYGKQFHSEDRPTWEAISRQKAITGNDCWGGRDPETVAYYKDYLLPNGFRYVAAAPLKAPVLPGYGGALQLWRSGEQGPFTDAEVAELGRIASKLDEAIERARKSRLTGSCAKDLEWVHKPAVRQFILNGKLEPRLPGHDLGMLDDRLREQMLDHARNRIGQLDGQTVLSDRLQLPDSRGDLWIFHVESYAQYPALGEGPSLFFCLQPNCCDWGGVRPADFQADPELSRLIPALRFMQQEFPKGPTLGQISKTVHLSPFHFHRRFTELLGITPKHFLLECQIYEAKLQLMSREKPLRKIALDCGFAHQSHFTSRFKQATGLTPTRWRRMAMKLRSGH